MHYNGIWAYLDWHLSTETVILDQAKLYTIAQASFPKALPLRYWVLRQSPQTHNRLTTGQFVMSAPAIRNGEIRNCIRIDCFPPSAHWRRILGVPGAFYSRGYGIKSTLCSPPRIPCAVWPHSSLLFSTGSASLLVWTGAGFFLLVVQGCFLYLLLCR